MARRKKGQDIDGIVLLDKPVGCSSNAALQRVRRAFDARKAGHTGSLDPLASGLLPVCLGEATKISSYLLGADKHYRVDGVIGFETTTGDREGDIRCESDTPLPGIDAINATLARFTGRGQQVPPMYSALKKDGKRLYELARAGETVEREPRDIIVHELTLVAVDANVFTLDVRVSSGTYIRTLVEDIARSWGACAHVGALRRVNVGTLGTDHQMTPLAEIEQRGQDDERGGFSAGEMLAPLLLPLSTVMADWPTVVLDDADAGAIGHGRTVACSRMPGHAHEVIVIADTNGRLLGLGAVGGDGRLAPRRLFARAQR